ncbi:hypothetical protein B0H14DRAFT_2556685 [Mycena olivaceomarginata]|nr:hypothetical protein B0H14DRAFT_2556685 [Mycena olivaceomarginata]
MTVHLLGQQMGIGVLGLLRCVDFVESEARRRKGNCATTSLQVSRDQGRGGVEMGMDGGDLWYLLDAWCQFAAVITAPTARRDCVAAATPGYKWGDMKNFGLSRSLLSTGASSSVVSSHGAARGTQIGPPAWPALVSGDTSGGDRELAGRKPSETSTASEPTRHDQGCVRDPDVDTFELLDELDSDLQFGLGDSVVECSTSRKPLLLGGANTLSLGMGGAAG